MNGEQAKLLLHYFAFRKFATLENWFTYQCPSSWPVGITLEKKLAGTWKIIGYWSVQINDNKFATGQILKKTGRNCEGVDYSWLSSKVSRTLNMTLRVAWYLMSLWKLFGWHIGWISERILSWVMDEFVYWPKPYLLLSAVCDEILSWMIEIWMKNHSVSHGNCNTAILTFSVGDTIPRFTISSEQDN